MTDEGTFSLYVEFHSWVSLVEGSRIDIPSGTVAYMGDYTANLNARMSFPLPILEFESATGGRTAEGRSRAQEMLKTTYPDSPWLKRPIN